MHHQLGRVTDRAEAGGLTLPQNLHDWTRWLSDVGRLSFPTGPVVAALDVDDEASSS